MSDSSRPKFRWWIAAAVVGVVLFAVIGLWYVKDRNEKQRVAARAEAAQLAHLKNVGLSQLENAEAFEGGLPLAVDAETAFAEITQRRSNLVLGPRNLTIARLISLAGGADPDRLPTGEQPAAEAPEQSAADEALKAVTALRAVEPDSAVTAVLAARTQAAIGDFAAARAELGKATTAAPDEAWVWYERYRLDRFASDPELKNAAQEALGRAYAADPTNLWVTREWLTTLAARQSPGLTAVARKAAEVLAPLAEGIEQRTRVNVLELLEQAAKAAEQGDWPTATRAVRSVVNVTVQEEQVQADKLAVDRNALEFVAIDFPPEFYESVGLARRPAPQPIAVSFEPGLVDLQGVVANKVTDLAVVDFDIDGKLDVVLVDGASVVVSSFEAEGRRDHRMEVPGGFTRLLAADLDADADPSAKKADGSGRPCHDADPDIVLFGPGGVIVLENYSVGGGLTPVEQSDDFRAVKDVLTAAVADFDLDGDLDLVVSAKSGMSLWANVGQLKFEERSSRTALPPTDSQPTQILPVDLDRDVDIDLVLAGGNGPPGYLENLHHSNLRWRPLEQLGDAHAIELVDADGNASWDLLLAGEKGLSLVTSQTPQPGRWLPQEPVSVAKGDYDQLRQLDYDNDGLPDLLASQTDGGNTMLLRNVGGRFEAVELLGANAISSAADSGDLDADGDLDLVLSDGKSVQALENRGGNANPWLDVSLLAQQVKGADASASGRVNHAGIGSLLELKAGPIYQPAVVRGSTTHFGLGANAAADAVRVLWTNGIPQNVIKPAPKSFVCERQSLKGSCPYLYTYDGEKFVFSTDLLWSAPIGLQFAEGAIAPTRPWEYLKITTPLQPNDAGQYVLQITEELWEAAYFDQVELIAVDHPASVELFTNEKVGPPDLAAHRLHTVTHPIAPRAARDGKGREILELVSDRDDRYVKAFDVKHTQGLCEPHAIELDFGNLDDAQRITLFLTGWVYPSDTSINIALGQRSDLPRSRPPALSVPNEQGRWVEVIPYMGFPGGKTKTIAVDLTGKFLCDDRRVRIDTTMELCWDAAFVTVDEPAVAVVTRKCSLSSADLHFRGVSAPIEHPQFGPERYDYPQVNDVPTWPPMRGRFTRYGDVTELLRNADDLQAIFTAGDEVTLRFDAPAPPPPGWTRTFVLHNVGYDKDADLNTVYGQSSEPLPFLKMDSYPYEPRQHFPATRRHRRYLQEYQTRSLSPRSFWTAVRDSVDR